MAFANWIYLWAVVASGSAVVAMGVQINTVIAQDQMVAETIVASR